ncbi:hypothetical protein Tco_0528302 [Tanacetum coccineum]
MVCSTYVVLRVEKNNALSLNILYLLILEAGAEPNIEASVDQLYDAHTEIAVLCLGVGLMNNRKGKRDYEGFYPMPNILSTMLGAPVKDDECHQILGGRTLGNRKCPVYLAELTEEEA